MTFAGGSGRKDRYPLKVVRATHGRYGRFECSSDVMTLDSEVAQLMMSQVIVVNCKHDLLRGIIEYTALGKQFSEVLDGGEIPMYTPIVTQHPLGTLPRYTIAWLAPESPQESPSP